MKKTEEKFKCERFTESDALYGAFLLLYDTSIVLTGLYNNRSESKFEQLAYITKHIDNKYLNVANCFREIAFGNKEYISILKNYLDMEEYLDLFANTNFILSR